MKECGAKKKNGTPCRMSAMPNGRCRLHGGKSLAGLASPTYQTGRYSKALPARLAARYATAEADPRLLELRDEVALTDARLADLLGRVDTGESGALWQALQTLRMDVLAARRVGDTVRQAAALNALLDTIGQAHADYRAWTEIGGVLEQRRRLVESERKRLVEMQQTLTVEKAMLLIGAIGGIIKAHVHDRAILSAIGRDLEGLLAREDAALISG